MSAVPIRGPASALERLGVLFEQQRETLPAPIVEAKRAALEQFLAHGFPSQAEEHWKYTNLRRLTNRTFELPLHAPAVMDARVPGIDADCWHRLVFIDGHRMADPATSQLLDDGALTIRSVAELLRSGSPDAASLLAAGPDTALHPFAALNAALTQDGVVIDCAAGADVSTPLYLIFLHSSERAWMTHPHLTVRLAANSRLQLIEHHLGTSGEYFTNAVTRIELGLGAKLEHYRLQQEGPRAFHIGLVTADVARDASFVSHTFALGGSLGRTDLNVRLREPGARTELNGLFFAATEQHLDTYTRIEHIAPHTQSFEDYRGIATDRGRGIFNGKVIVRPEAQKIESQQSSRNLLLSNTAEIDTRPELEIYADDVKCAHGATTGQLDAEAIFYLRSRGMDEAEARRVLTVAFAHVVLGQMRLAPVREHIEQALRAPLGMPAGTPS